ncbi:IQ domain-containing protein-containing RasGAP [Crepidotus variabilis]|uniref:IQ domain-containing protein-containing RasGAP n=1 Tax=Crepidotus variabilis TaxID=179855 RepID=A0A9P6JVB6_9AGAR|nr:IQ domain-containing protein-containing RasGAP [Crepidotus variabilis]
MDRSNSTSSNGSNGPRAGASAPFAYQTRLLERTSSRSGPHSLSRANSQSSTLSLLTNTTGSSAGSLASRKWTGSHRVTNSLDVMRGKWEDRTRETLAEEPRSSSPTKDISRNRSENSSASTSSTVIPSSAPPEDRTFLSRDRPMTPPSMTSFSKDTTSTTPKYLKRQTMPAPIIASPLSPNSTGISVEADSPLSITPHRIRIPVADTPASSVTNPASWRAQLKSTSSSSPTKGVFSSTTSSTSSATATPTFHRPTRSQTLEASSPSWKIPISHNSRLESSASPPTVQLDDRKISSPRLPAHQTTHSVDTTNHSPRPTHSLEKTRFTRSTHSIDNHQTTHSVESIHMTSHPRPTSRYDSTSSIHPTISATAPATLASALAPAPAPGHTPNPTLSPTPPTVPSVTVTHSPVSPQAASVMFPAPYRSSYMSSRKAGTFDSLSAGGDRRRRLGSHLPRIASGDGDESWPNAEKENPHKKNINSSSNLKPEEPASLRRQERTTRVRDRRFAAVIQEKKLTPSGVLTGNGVAGLPGRISLKAPIAQDANPTPTSRFLGGSWADKQRHLLQAYEYLCHVGEAQQWIEGCLGEELECGVVELEDHLQNGVILAKLVRAFQGEAAVKKIYEGGTKRYDFRHSENINHFVRFVREINLPEGFIFELTDLYEKKNLPKVIYCIHALSHLLAYRGMAQKIGNLLGQLHFSDDQLIRTQKGLKDAGVAMPNFGNVGKEVAKEIEPPAQEETEDEKRDRMLLECEPSIIALQQQARGYLVRNAITELKNRGRLAEKHIVKLQTQAKAILIRRRIAAQRQSQVSLVPFAVSLQARARGLIVRRRWQDHLRALRRSVGFVVKVQAQIRGVLQRRRYKLLKAALRKISFPTKKLQAAARGHILRHTQKEITKSFFKPKVSLAVVALQAHCRGVLVRRSIDRRMYRLNKVEGSVVKLQAHCRGLIVRRRLRAQQAKLKNVADIVIGIQSAVRTYLARKRLLALIRGLRRATSVVVSFQARAKASLVRQHQQSLQKALVDVRTIKAVGKLQALARASIVRTQHRELDKQLEISLPDVIGLQAAARGAMVRDEYHAWRDHLHRNHHIASALQAMLRGALVRRTFRKKMEYFRSNLSKVVKIQSLFRAKETREQYRQLTLGKNVTVGTIKNFVHLLDDSEADFQEEIKVERLRKRVVEAIRENQALEHDIDFLEQRIARLVDNMRTVEDIVMAKKKYADGSALHAARASLLAAHGDIFSAAMTLDQEARRKLELYQQLFYLLQTRPEYLAGLLFHLSSDETPEESRRFVERTILTLFGYGQDRREDFLLLKLFQQAIRDEVVHASSLDSIIFGHPLYLNIAVQYVRPRKATYVKDALQGIIRELIETDDLDIESDPSKIHRARVEVEEMRSAKPSNTPKDLPFRDAVSDPDTRAIYIRHLQLLQWWTEAFVNVITQSTKKMPYNMRYLARETFAALQDKFTGASPELYGACLGRLIFTHYIQPVLENPDAFDIVPKSALIMTAKQNLEEISKVLEQITSGVEFDDDNPSYVPINDFVRKAISQMTAWYFDVANVPDAEAQFHAHEFMDATVQPKAIYISPNEIYTIHSLLIKQVNQQKLGRDDALRIILTELGGVPRLDIAELKDARETQITLELTNRFAHVKDPQAEEKTLWVQAKRGVLAILRVQPAQDLLESLMRPVTENDELLWEEILETELETEVRQIPRRQPSAVNNDSAYRLEDIRLLKFAAVKALAISNLLELEKQGKISREDGFQGILNAIAGDVRSKHRKRLQRQQEMQSMNEALRQLADRKKFFQEQLDTYQAVAESAMSTMQRGGKTKRHFALPFTKQFFHQRDLHKAGVTPQFGSYIYSAKQLYNRRILLSVDSYSPRQFDKLEFTFSSNVPGIFNIRLESTILGISSVISSEDVRMEDLLQSKYEKRASISILKGKVKVNLELFLGQINKKFNS